MPSTAVYVPVSAVFPDVNDDFASFCALVRTLSRTDTIFWCARLNLIVSNPHNRDEKGKQEYAVYHFFDAHEVELLNRFMAEHRSARVFFREQLLELIRWTCLLAADDADDGNTYEDPETRRRFAQAALIASELWGQRVYAGGLPSTGDQLRDRRRFMPVLRAGVVETAPDVMRVLVRGDAIYRAAFQHGYTDAEAQFRAATGVTLSQYMACLRALTVHFGNVDPKAAKANWGGFRLDAVRADLPDEMQIPFDRYVQYESQTADELRAALWGGRPPSDVTGTEAFDSVPLRERPIFRTADGRAIILDQVFYGEKAAVGPLFTLVKALDDSGKRDKINTVFGAFGKAFEGYVNGLLRTMYPSSPLLPDRLVCNPKGTTADGHEVEIGDACLNDVTEVVLLESKASFLREEAAKDAGKYERELRKKYGATEGTADDRGTKGAAQLGRWIKGIALDEVKPTGQDWGRVERVYPVLVVYDVSIDRPGHAEFFEEEFARALTPDRVLARGYMQKGRLTVAPLAVMTINDLENLESSVEHFRLTDLLRDYANGTLDGVRLSLHDFMAHVEGKKYRFVHSKDLATRAVALLEETHRAMFPHLLFPDPPSQ